MGKAGGGWRIGRVRGQERGRYQKDEEEEGMTIAELMNQMEDEEGRSSLHNNHIIWVNTAMRKMTTARTMTMQRYL